MTENEQIEEMARIISTACKGIRCSDCETHGNETSACVDVKSAEALYSKGYRKVERGEWMPYTIDTFEYTTDMLQCSSCEFTIHIWQSYYRFCPNCGADMRKEDEGK